MKTALIKTPPARFLFLTVAAFVMMATGCTSVKKGFSGTEHENITPFAQKTVEVLGFQDIQLRDNEFIYLRMYADSDFPELDRLQLLLDRTDTFRERVISYSVDLVRITEIYNNDADKVTAYADGVDYQLRKQGVGALEMPTAEWDALIADIRAQPDLLSGLRAFQPVINEAGRFYEELLTEIEAEILVDVRAGFDQRIQIEFGVPIKFLDNHFNRRDEILTGLNLIHAYRHGDAAAIEGLRQGNIIVDRSLLPKGDFSAKQVSAIEKALGDELVQSTLLLDQIEQDVDDYTKTRDELDRKEAEVIAGLGLARLQFLTWARSHQALANGVKEPGKWMELSVKAGQLLGNAL